MKCKISIIYTYNFNQNQNNLNQNFIKIIIRNLYALTQYKERIDGHKVPFAR